MITLRITYPYDANARFDEDYFVSVHIPLACEVMAPEYVAVRVLKPMVREGEQPPMRMIAEFDFPSREARARALGNPRMSELGDDVPNYSDVRGTISILEDITGSA